MKIIITKLNTMEYSFIQCHTQAGGITTNIKVEMYFTLPDLIATKIVTWNFHVDESTRGIYDMILGRYIFKYLVLNINYLITSLNHMIDLLKG